jgi:hypothetical protein
MAVVSAQSTPPSRPATARPAVSTSSAHSQVTPTVKPVATHTPAASQATAESERALINKYCVTCHNARLKTANLLLDQLDLSHLADHAEIGETVVRKLRAGMMPPTGMPRPDAAQMETLVSWMEGELDRGAKPYLEPPGLHRLNRTEYTNAIRDLLALDVDATKFLPPDDSTRGFDNIAGALKMSPTLMEGYLSAAGKISRLAIGDGAAPAQAVFNAPGDTAQNYHVEGLPFGTRGGMLIDYEFPADGEYAINVKGVTGYFTRVMGDIAGEKVEVMVDGQLVKVFDWDRDIKNTQAAGAWTPRVPIKAGLHHVGVTFIATNDVPGSELDKPFERTMDAPGEIPGLLSYPHVGQVSIQGPFNATAATDTPSRHKVFVCYPATAAAELPCARKIVSTLVKHAFRRPATAVDMDTMMTFYQEGRKEGKFDDGIQAALQRILADPQFVYRQEQEPAGLAAGASYRITDEALASRLSFFLWSSIPDDELIDLAAQNKLHQPAVLAKEVKRMLADPRSEALVTNFTGQWLNVRGLAASEPAVNIYPDFDANLRTAYEKEIDLFFGNIVQNDRSVLDLLDAKDTFVNERLAKAYGIPNIYGSRFRHVTLPESLDVRRGLLGKGALMTVTSNAARTSPVARGKWFLQTFLGVSPPSPPPNVPAIKERAADLTGNSKPPTMRETMEMHHTAVTCATCHKIFEPIGFALENFDADGSFRTEDAGSPIDASAIMVDGTKVNGVNDLRAYLVRHDQAFLRTFSERLLTYALGRGVEYQDMPLVRQVVHDAEPTHYSLSSLVLGIVKSPQFQMNMKASDTPATETARR